MKIAGLIVLLPLAVSALQPNRIDTRILFTGEPTVALRILQNGFHSVGYKLDVRSFASEQGNGEITAEAVGLRPFDFAALRENLKDEEVEVRDEGSAKGILKLNADVRQANWNVPIIAAEEGIQLQRVQSPQWFRVESNQQIRIEPPYVGKWYPEIAVLDRSMNVLHSLRSDSPSEEYELLLPEGAYYLKVSNVWGMKALGDGMWIESKTPER